MLNPYRLLEYNAKVFPGRIALHDGGESLTYAQLYALTRGIAGKLGKLGVKAGDLVVTCLPPKLDWLFTSALFHEACVTCSNHGYNPLDPKLEVDWIISDKKVESLPEDKLIVIDQPWINGLSDEPPSEICKDYANEDALCRLILTSGTTGFSKAAAFSVGLLNGRMLRLRAAEGISPTSAVSLMPLSTALGFFIAMNSLFAAETCHAPNNIDALFSLMDKKPVTYLVASPMQLSALLKKIEQEKRDIERTLRTILVAGFALSPALYDKLVAIFGADIYCSYGSTEVGRVCINRVRNQRQLNVAGVVVYDADIEILDDKGTVLAVNEDGIVRIKAPYVIKEYYKNTEATEQFLKDGWFYPGDRGRLTKNGVLVLSGRVDEVINRGGVKVDPVSIDQFLLDYDGVKDAAVVGLENEHGLQQITAALVVEDGFDMQALQVATFKKFLRRAAPEKYFRVSEIPRNKSGKVVRGKIKQAIADFISKNTESKSA